MNLKQNIIMENYTKKLESRCDDEIDELIRNLQTVKERIN